MARSWSKEAHGFGRPHEVWQGDLTQGRPRIELLPDTHRQFLELRLDQGLSSQRTAERLHLSRSSVSTRLNRAVRLLMGRVDAQTQSFPSGSSKK